MLTFGAILLARLVKIVSNPVIAVTINPIGPVAAVIAILKSPAALVTTPKPVTNAGITVLVSVPMAIRSGPMAATTPATTKITFLVCGVSALNSFNNSFTFFIIFSKVGSII